MWSESIRLRPSPIKILAKGPFLLANDIPPTANCSVADRHLKPGAVRGNTFARAEMSFARNQMTRDLLTRIIVSGEHASHS